VEHSPAVTAVGWLATVVRVLLRFLDFSGFEGIGPRFAVAAAILLVAAAAAAALMRADFARSGKAASPRVFATAMLVPVVWPLVVLGAATSMYALLRTSHFPIDPSGTSEGVFSWRPSSRDHEDFSYFGPLGAIVLVVAAGSLTPAAWRRSPSRAALALCLPVFLAGLALAYRFNEFLGRFMLLPVVVVAALLAGLYERRALAVGVASLAVATLALVQINNELKPMRRAPWSLSRAETLDLQSWQAGIGAGVDALETTVPADACVGAALGADDASYPLFGPHLRRRVSYVAPLATGLGAPTDDAVILGPGESSLQPGVDRRVSSLGGYWRLAVRKSVTRPFDCHAPSSTAP
jgi:hypothetical protein